MNLGRIDRGMELSTDQPGLQLYVAGGLDGSLRGKEGVAYGRWQGLCLEPQHHPDSANHPGWPSIELRPGETYRHRTVFRFDVDGDQKPTGDC